MWDDVDALERLAGGLDRQHAALYSSEFLGFAQTESVWCRPVPRPTTPALPARRVRLAMSHYERGTANPNVYAWLSRAEADDDFEISMIKEHASD